MQQPTVGRIVHYIWGSAPSDTGFPAGARFAAIIADVNANESVHLTVFIPGGLPQSRLYCERGKHWEWPVIVKGHKTAAAATGSGDAIGVGGTDSDDMPAKREI